MRITLEMVDEVINRTGVSYKEAKEALELHEGDLLKSIVYIEDLKSGKGKDQKSHMSGQEIVDKLKVLVNEGFINQITVVKNGKTVVDIPIMAGAIGAVIFTIPTVAAIIAAVATGCEIKISKKDGEVININEMTQEKFEDLKNIFRDKKDADEGFDGEEEMTDFEAEDDLFEDEEDK